LEQNGKLEINACYLECGKYICDFYGDWLARNDTLQLKFHNDLTDATSTYKYRFKQIDDSTIQLIKLSVDIIKD
jgi:hypothetical protein